MRPGWTTARYPDSGDRDISIATSAQPKGNTISSMM
jgi:hypothetical protein